MSDVVIVDSTLRDGSHAIAHQFTAKNISDYSSGAEAAGIPLLVVGHGNGLGASSLQLGKSLLSDTKMLKVAKKGLDTYGILMMSHMIGANELLEQAKLVQQYGASGVLLMDSAGAYLPENVTEKIEALVSGLEIGVGFHAHNNLGLAVANSISAVRAGAKILDCTTRGMGAGAGNSQLEVVVAVLLKMGYKLNLDLFKLMDNSEKIISKIAGPQVISVTSLTSGLAGVFSGFAPHIRRASKKFGVDVRDILIELKKRKVVAGQEDIIVDVALSLKKKKELKKEDYSIEAL